ncbi:MAG TPA: hypothetical protein VFF48_06635 [Brevundimonas sp.]|nr:hypothetical protein [Brevundimonas sp.]
MRPHPFPASVAALGFVAVACAAHSASAQALVTVREDHAALAGKWSEREVDCGNHPSHTRPVRELVVTPDGRFTLTWEPFESYTDYWGVVVHDAGAGIFRLEITGANSYPPPEQYLTGAAELAEDGRRLILDGVDLGDGQRHEWGRRCRYVFGRI